MHIVGQNLIPRTRGIDDSTTFIGKRIPSGFFSLLCISCTAGFFHLDTGSVTTTARDAPFIRREYRMREVEGRGSYAKKVPGVSVQATRIGKGPGKIK